VHNTSNVGQTSFGLGQVALNLAREQAELGCDARVWCMSSADDVRWAYASSNLSEGRIVRFSTVGPRWLAYSPSMMRAAKSEGGEIDIVHQHGIWTYGSYVTHLFHQRHCTPYVIAPHGSLESWALRRARWKKFLALVAYERANLFGAACFHATSESEIEDFRNFGLIAPVALIPNGVSSRWLNSRGDAKNFRESFGIPADRRILFFLSRITPKKGLLMLIQAINAIRKEFADWILVIAGKDEFDHKAEVERLVKQLGMEDLVRLIGPLFDQPKRDAFAASDLFVLPSFSEGSPVAILDSLAVGVPVITTKAAPWKNLDDYFCGWWVDVSVSGLIEALRNAINLSSEELVAMGQRGHDLVTSKYTWAASAQKTLDLYEWLLGRRDKPGFVVVD